MRKALAASNSLDPVVAELVRVRKLRGLSQQEVADKAGISRRSLVSIEAGGDCTLSTLRGLSAALGVKIEPQTSEPAGPRMPLARSFTTAEEMSRYQQARELEEALRVQAMMPYERAEWLARTWGALQRQANSLFPDRESEVEPAARHFPTLEAKNNYDDERETRRAVRLALSRGDR